MVQEIGSVVRTDNSQEKAPGSEPFPLEADQYGLLRRHLSLLHVVGTGLVVGSLWASTSTLRALLQRYPFQRLWIVRHDEMIAAAIVFCVGLLLFVSGYVRQAPRRRLIRKLDDYFRI